jgi:hypothetical protein
MRIVAHFVGRPGDELDEIAHLIISMYGKVTGAGTMLIPPYERDVEGEIPARAFIQCRAELQRAGMRVSEPM